MQPSRQRRRWRRRASAWLVATTLSLPLLQSGSCVEILERSLINGFFQAITPMLQQNAETALGLESAAPGP